MMASAIGKKKKSVNSTNFSDLGYEGPTDDREKKKKTETQC